MVRINNSIIKHLIARYLKDGSHKNSSATDDDSSLFDYKDEIKDYLLKKYDIDWDEININLEDLLSMSYEDGKFSLNEEDEVDSEELEDGVEFDKDQFLVDYINEFINNDDVKTVIDKDEDGILSEEEVHSFFSGIKGEDGDKETISLKDLNNKYSDIKANPFELDKTEAQNAPQSNSSPSGSSGGGNHYSNNSNVDSNNDDSSLQNNNQANGDYSSMSLDSLNSLKSENQNQLNNYETELQQALSGNVESIEAAKKEYENAKTTYEQVVENDEALSEIKAKVLENTNAIEAKKADIAATEVEQSQNDAAIFSKEGEINSLTSNINALNASKTTLEGQKDNKELSGEVSKKLSSVEAKIADYEKKKQAAQKELETLKNQQEALALTMQTKNEELSALESEKTNLDNEILENEKVSDGTKNALNDFNTAKANLDKAKEEAVSSAQNNIKTSKAEIDKIDAVINEKEAQKLQSENSVNNKELFTNAGYNIQTLVSENGTTYSIAVPKDYDPNKKYPAFTWLSGLGQKGTDINKLYRADLGKALVEDPASIGFNGIFIMYQTPDGNAKDEVGRIKEVTKDAMKRFNIDDKNIVIGGHSEGCNGVQACAADNEDNLFSAALICSGNHTSADKTRMNIPIIGVSGSKDWLYNQTQGVVGTMKKIAKMKGFTSKVQSQFIDVGNLGHNRTATAGFHIMASNGKPLLLQELFPDYV